MRFDVSHFCDGYRALEGFPENVRRYVVHGHDEIAALAASRVVAGHFCLATLRRLAPISSIATIIREPRRRLISLYSLWRLGAAQPDAWPPYYCLATRPLERFLADPAVAAATDNRLCRMLLDDGATMPPGEFLAVDEIPQVAAAAIERLDSLGYVGLLESDGGFWAPLSEFFGVRLEPVHENAAESPGVSVGATARELLDRRTAADALVYEYALARRRPAPAQST